MAQSTANAASSYYHDSPDISLSRKLADGDLGGRNMDGHYGSSGHLPPISRKYLTTSARADELREHVTDLYIDTNNDPLSSSKLTFSSKVVPSALDSSLSETNVRDDPSKVSSHNHPTAASSKNVRVCTGYMDGSRFVHDTQPPDEEGRDGINGKNSSGEPSKEKYTGDDNFRHWKRFHRIVEQMDDEPCCIIVFKWLLIVVGLGMLIYVIEIMGEVMYMWFSGDLEEKLQASKLALKSRPFLINSTTHLSESRISDSLEFENTTTNSLQTEG